VGPTDGGMARPPMIGKSTMFWPRKTSESQTIWEMPDHEPSWTRSDFKWQPDSRDNIIQWFCTWWLIPRNVSGLVHPSFLSGLPLLIPCKSLGSSLTHEPTYDSWVVRHRFVSSEGRRFRLQWGSWRLFGKQTYLICGKASYFMDMAHHLAPDFTR